MTTCKEVGKVISLEHDTGLIELKWVNAMTPMHNARVTPSWLVNPDAPEPPVTNKDKGCCDPEQFEEVWTIYRKALKETQNSPGTKKLAKRYFMSGTHMVKACEFDDFVLAMNDYLTEKLQTYRTNKGRFCDAAHFSTFISTWWRDQLEVIRLEQEEDVPYATQRERQAQNVPDELVEHYANQYPEDYLVPIPYHADARVRDLEIQSGS
jgi:hypothetical protein